MKIKFIKVHIETKQLIFKKIITQEKHKKNAEIE